MAVAKVPSKWVWAALFALVPLAYNPVSRWQWEPDKVALVMAFTGVLLGRSVRRGKVHGRLSCFGCWRRPEVWIGLYLLVRASGLTCM